MQCASITFILQVPVGGTKPNGGKKKENGRFFTKIKKICDLLQFFYDYVNRRLISDILMTVFLKCFMDNIPFPVTLGYFKNFSLRGYLSRIFYCC